jgi:23S rRNA G2069 N7-methylase RlmK/C1962 C5-methylase RlmI
MVGSLDLRRDYRNLIRRCLSLLSPGGTLYFRSNARGFHLEAGTDFPGFTIKDITKDLTDEDFRGKKSPVCYTFKGV